MTARRTLATAATFLAVALVACGGGDTGGPDDDGTTRLSMLLFGGAEEVVGYRTMIAEFEAANPDVEVELTPVGKQDDLLAKLATSFSAGIPPDVFLVNFRSFRQFADEDALAPVQPFLDASAELSADDFVEPPLAAFRVDGELVCQPQNVSSLVVYYNRDLFEDRGVPLPTDGWTWDDFLAAAERLTGDGTFGVGTEPSLVHGVVPPDVEARSEEAESRFIAGRLGMYLNSRRSVPDPRTIPGFTGDVPPASAEVFVANAGIARATPSTASWRRIEKLADGILEQVFYGRIDREAGIDRLLEETRDAFARAG